MSCVEVISLRNIYICHISFLSFDANKFVFIITHTDLYGNPLEETSGTQTVTP